MPYRARRVVAELGISLGDLVEAGGRSRSTWSRLLGAKLDPEPPGLRETVEALLEARGEPLPRDLWALEPGEGATTTEMEEVLMQGHTLSEPARQHFRLFRSPFDPDAMVDPDGRDHLSELYLPLPHFACKTRLMQALTKAGFCAMYGEPGSGKSTLLELALRDAEALKPIIRVSPANVERRKMSAMHIGAELIRQLSEESIPRTANLRDHKALEVLKQRYHQGQRVALVIDEAHELPEATIKDLKRFHEMSDSYVRLLAVVLIGQTELAGRFNAERNHALREVIIRCQLMQLPPLKDRGDVMKYMARRFEWVGAQLFDAWEQEAAAELERRLSEHDQQIPVVIGNVAAMAMNLAYERGQPLVTADEVIDVFAMVAERRQEIGGVIR